MKAIILAAGAGRRLGRQMPKSLIRLGNGKRILTHQLDGLLRLFRPQDITVVVGFKKEHIVEAFPDLTYLENPDYRTTSTARSLQIALESVRGHPFLFVEGDVVCDPRVFTRVAECEGDGMATHRIPLGEEEMKFSTRQDGTIHHLSKELSGGEGEALAVNKFNPEITDTLLHNLRQCDDMDFFERAIETCIEDGFRVFPIDVSDLYGFDVDFPEDLEEANRALQKVGQTWSDVG